MSASANKPAPEKITRIKIENLARPKTPGVFFIEAPVHTNSACLSGFQSGWSIETAVQLIRRGLADALVTGPIHKERFRAGGYPFAGHTDFLSFLCKKGPRPLPVVMMLANSVLRVSLVTTHISVVDVSSNLSVSQIRKTIEITAKGLRQIFNIRKPKIAVCALNPHAGEGGLLGSEEIKTIRPALRLSQKHLRKVATLTGPHPADTFFAINHTKSAAQRVDAVVCMYHDQGLIPVKLLDFKNTVNITLGLPIIRISVDHGVAFDIVGKGLADPSSMESAFALALKCVKEQHGKKQKTLPL